jgi:hypothetical protein
MPTAASATPRQRRTTAGTSRLCLTVASAALRQRCATAGCSWLGLTVVSPALIRRWVAAGCSWLGLTVVSAVLRQRCATAGCSWLGLTVVSLALIRRWVAAGLGCRLPKVDDRGLAGSDVTPAGWLWASAGAHRGVVRVRERLLPATVGSHAGAPCSRTVAGATPRSHKGRPCASGVAEAALLRRRCWAVRLRRRDRGGVTEVA